MFSPRFKRKKRHRIQPVPLGPSGCNWQASLGVMLNDYDFCKARTIWQAVTDDD